LEARDRRPFGDDRWTDRTARRLNLRHTLRPEGRPPKKKLAASLFPSPLSAAGLEEGLWLCPIEDRRQLDSPREGMLEGFSLGNYFLLVDYTGRLFRPGKVAISAEVRAIFERLCSSVENWQSRMRKLVSGRLLGRFFAATRSRLREVAQDLGVHDLVNLAGCVSR
jgi:hypothetical protein